MVDGLLLVLDHSGLTARDARTGELAWRQPNVSGACQGASPPLLPLEGVVSVARGSELIFVEPTTGTLTGSIELPGAIRAQSGPPLVVDVEDTRLLRIDPAGPSVLASRTFPRYARTALVTDDVVLVTAWPERHRHQVRALRTDGLSDLWALDDFARVEVRPNAIYLQRVRSRELVELDSQRGALGPTLELRGVAQTEAPVRGFEDLFQVILDDYSGSRIVRADPQTGEERWSKRIPGFASGFARAGNELLVHWSPRESPGFLVAVDWDTGRNLRAARSIRGHTLRLYDDLLLITGERDVVVASAHELGPPESLTTRLEDSIREMLAREPDGWNLGDQLQEARALGPEAHPILLRELPTMSPLWVTVVTPLLAFEKDPSIVPALLARLERERGEDDVSARARTTLLGVLGYLKDPRAVPALREALRDHETRRRAWFALAHVGDASAASSLARMVERDDSRPYRFHAPTPSDYLEWVGEPFVDDRPPRIGSPTGAIYAPNLIEIDHCCFDPGDRVRRLHRRALGASAVELPDGGHIIVYSDARVGSRRDLWAMQRDTIGRFRGEPLFLGAALENDCNACILSARVESGTLHVVDEYFTSKREISVDLAAAALDSDGDGWTDWLEQRIGTRPDRRDSDDDGTPDPRDAQPDAVPKRPTSETEELVETVFQQWFLLADDQRRAEPIVVEHEKPLRWRGRTGPSLTMTEEDARATLLDDAVTIPRYRIEPVSDHDFRSSLLPALGLETGSTRVFRMTRTIGFDGHNAASNVVILTELGTRWIIRHVVPE